MRCTPGHSTLIVYADATGTDTMVLKALTDADSDNRSGFAVAGHLRGNRHSIDRAQNVRQGYTRGSSIGRCRYLHGRRFTPYSPDCREG